jgi:tetratricopeptide (TPR) repeat protein
MPDQFDRDEDEECYNHPRINEVIGHLKRARAYQDARQYESAIAECSQAMQLIPTFGVPRFQRAAVYLAKRAVDQALMDFTEVVRLYAPKQGKNYLDALRGRAACLYRLSRTQEAIADYTTLIQCKPDEAEYYHLRAQAYLDLGEHDRVIADADAAITRNSTLAEAYFDRALGHHGRARRLEREGNRSAAQADDRRCLADYQTAIRLDPTVADRREGKGAKFNPGAPAAAAPWPPWKAPLIYLGFGALFMAFGLLAKWLKTEDSRPYALGAIGAVIALGSLIWLIVAILPGFRKK